MAKFSHYRIEIRHASTDAVLRTYEPVYETRLTYPLTENAADHGGAPARQFKAALFKITDTGDVSEAQIQLVSNLAPAAPTGVTLTAVGNAIEVRADASAEQDVVGMRVWMSTSPGFTPGAATLVHDSPNTRALIPVSTTGTYYFRVAYFDSLGTHELNLAPQAQLSIVEQPVKDEVPPGDPSGLSAAQMFMGAVLSWTNPSDDDLSHIEVWHCTSSDLNQAVLNASVHAPASGHSLAGLGVDTTQYFWIRAVDTWQNKSSFVGPVSLQIRRLLEEELDTAILHWDNITTPSGAISFDKLSPNIQSEINRIVELGKSVIPPGIAAGANGDLSFLANKNSDGSESIGEIGVADLDAADGNYNGGFIHPTLGWIDVAGHTILTPWEGTSTGVPTNQRFYVMYSATAPSTRFAGSDQSSPQFTTIAYDEAIDEWKAYGNSVAGAATFTPDMTDLIVAIGTRSDASISGIETLTSLIGSDVPVLQRVATLETESADYESRISTQETVTGGHATRLTNVETLSESNETRVQTVEGTTATHATRLTATETIASDAQSRVATQETVTSGHATRLSATETIANDAQSRVATQETVTSGHATRLTATETIANNAQSRVATQETVTAGHATRLSATETVANNATSRTAILEEALFDGVETSARIMFLADANGSIASGWLTSTSNPAGVSQATVGFASDFFRVFNGVSNEQVFFIDTAANKAYLKGDFFASGSISGDAINAASAVRVGTGAVIPGTSIYDRAAVGGQASGNYRFWAGGLDGASSNFSVDREGKITARNITILTEDGGSVWFDTESGFSEIARAQILAQSATRVGTVADTATSNTASVDFTLITNEPVKAKGSVNVNGVQTSQVWVYGASEPADTFPSSLTVKVEWRASGGAWATGVTKTYTKITSGIPTATQYLVEEYAQAPFRHWDGEANAWEEEDGYKTEVITAPTELVAEFERTYTGDSDGETYEIRVVMTPTGSPLNLDTKTRTITMTPGSGSSNSKPFIILDGGQVPGDFEDYTPSSFWKKSELNISDYLPRGGGTMTGDITMGLNKIDWGSHTGHRVLAKIEGKDIIQQISDRGGMSFTAADDAMIIGSGDVARSLHNSVDANAEVLYLASDANAVILTGLQAGYGAHQQFEFLSDGIFKAPVDIKVAGNSVWHAGNFVPSGKSDVGHGHAISNVTGLQSALDGKLATSGGTVTGHTTFNADLYITNKGTGDDHRFVSYNEGSSGTLIISRSTASWSDSFRLAPGIAQIYVGNAAATWNGTTFTATNFSGNGAALTALNASQLTSGTIPDARIPALAISKTTGLQSALDGKLAVDGVSTYVVGAANAPTDDLNSFTGQSQVHSVFANANAPSTNGWYNVVNVRHRGGQGDGTDYGGQLAWGMNTNTSVIAFRSNTSASSWTGWKKLWHDGNLNPADYLPKAGGTITGRLTVEAVSDLTPAIFRNVGGSTITYSEGGSGYGAFYSKGSGVNAAYMFFGNTTSGERGRVTADNAGDIYFEASGNFLVLRTNGGSERGRCHPTGFTVTGDLQASGVIRQGASGTEINSSGLKLASGHTLSCAPVSSRNKLRLWDTGPYTIGMASSMTFGSLNDYAMTFQMSSSATRGFWWGHDGHTNAQGAMSLTTGGILQVNSTITAGGNITQLSDRRLKHSIRPWRANFGSMIDRLAPTLFGWNEESRSQDDFGFIAQDIAELFPQVIEKRTDGMMSVDYGKLSVVAIAALKEERARVTTLEDRITRIERLLEAA